MNKFIKTNLLIISLVLSSIGFGSNTYAWDDCPFGLENDPYPGECSRYVDTDSDGICDLSQPAPEDRSTSTAADEQTADTNISEQSSPTLVLDNEELEYIAHISGKELKALTISELAELWGGLPVSCLLTHLQQETGADGLTADTSVQYLHDTYALEPSQIRDIAQGVYEKRLQELSLETAEQETASSEVSTGEVADINSSTQTEGPMTQLLDQVNDSYHTIFLALIAAILFLSGKILVWSGKVKQSSERKFWNIVLLVFFIGSAATGLLLSLRRDAALVFSLPRNFLWLHAETSLTMAFISIYHIIWHWKYYWCIIKKPKK